MEKVPVAITVSRETGKIVAVERGEVKDQEFIRILAALSDQMAMILGQKA